jgi:hypothetical protein
VPVTTDEFLHSAERLAHSVLDNYILRMAVGDPMREWQGVLEEYLKNKNSIHLALTGTPLKRGFFDRIFY